jgi:hypothetical protein
VDRLDDGVESRSSESIVVWRKIAAGEEGLQIGREKDVIRPATASGHCLCRCHIQPVDVWSLLAIDLDVHEPGIHQIGKFLLAVYGLLRDMAPVAGAVTDGKEDRFVFTLCLCQPSPGYQSTGLRAQQ